MSLVIAHRARGRLALSRGFGRGERSRQRLQRLGLGGGLRVGAAVAGGRGAKSGAHVGERRRVEAVRAGDDALGRDAPHVQRHAVRHADLQLLCAPKKPSNTTEVNCKAREVCMNGYMMTYYKQSVQSGTQSHLEKPVWSQYGIKAKGGC